MTPEQTTYVLQTAVRAPSVHNTQPWQFAVEDDQILVRADRTRQLAMQDPRGRELLLSCGAATLHAQLAVRGLGRECRVDWLPEPDDADLVARLTVGPPRPTEDEERRLLDAVPLRHTDRSAFGPEPVSADLVERLRDSVEREGAWLTTRQSEEEALGLLVLAARADQMMRHDPQVRAEMAGWIHSEHEPAEGLPAEALPDHGRGRGSSLALRDFDPQDVEDNGDEPPEPERPLLLVLSTDGDAPRDWARAGAALARLLLTATDAGLVANPQTQVLELMGGRARVADELGLRGKPQVLLRIGWPTGPGSAHTGRRQVEDVVVPGRADDENVLSRDAEEVGLSGRSG